MKLDKISIRKILTYIQENKLETELLAIENKAEDKIQDVKTAHLVDLVSCHIGEKSISDLNQKRYRRGGIYIEFSPSFNIDEVTYVSVDLHAFKDKNISLSIFELRALLRSLKLKYGYEIVFIHGVDLMHFGVYNRKYQSFKIALLLNQLREMKDELFVVMVLSEKKLYFNKLNNT